MKQKLLLTLTTILFLIIAYLVGVNKFNGLRFSSDLSLSSESMAKESPIKLDRNHPLVNANLEFGLNLWREIVEESQEENVFISPTSIAFALGMLYNGADGKTQAEMATALQLQGMSLDEINQANLSLLDSLSQDKEGVKLTIANSLWAKEGVSFKPEFLENNRQFYQAKIQELDFNNPETITIINNWVKENTNGKIEEIIDDISAENILFLINAIYFKGIWQNEFDKNNTQNLPFYLADGSQKNHPMMSRNGQYPYYENEKFQGISLPYSDSELSMYIFLPKPDSNLPNFLRELNSENWKQWQSNFTKSEGNIQLPRFKLEYEIELNNTLKKLRMNSMFDRNQANFKSMTESQASVDTVKHKSFIEVNEEGTEAAAATSIGVRSTSIGLFQPFSMIVDRPFFFAIYDNSTNTILFMGSIFEPN